MKILFFILLISYSICLTTKRYDFIEALELYNSYKYNGSFSGISVLDTSRIEGDEIYISFSINQSSFNTESLNYDFSDDYPIVFFYHFPKKLEESHGISSSSTTTTKTGTKKKKISLSTLFYYSKRKQKIFNYRKFRIS